MSVHYLLDGYNVINQIPTLVQKKLDERRRGLVNLIEQYRPQGSLKNSVTVVFDGKPGVWSSEGSGHVKVVFSTGESADEKIKRMVGETDNKKQVVVITDDRAIKYYVRGLGAKVGSVRDFVARLKPRASVTHKKVKSRQGTKDGKVNIPKTTEYEITEEMQKIWLKKQ